MKDNMDERLERLFAAARDERFDLSVDDGFFETRLMARIRERNGFAEPWYGAAWRLLPAFAAVAAMITVCTLTFSPSKSSDIFAAITIGQDEIAGLSYLSGE
jgi:peptidoglycan/LPS O-acetylase OafA/YrhL